MKKNTDETVNLSFIAQELADQILADNPDLESVEDAINFALTYAVLTTHLPYPLQVAAPMALVMAAPKRVNTQSEYLKVLEK